MPSNIEYPPVELVELAPVGSEDFHSHCKALPLSIGKLSVTASSEELGRILNSDQTRDFMAAYSDFRVIRNIGELLADEQDTVLLDSVAAESPRTATLLEAPLHSLKDILRRRSSRHPLPLTGINAACELRITRDYPLYSASKPHLYGWHEDERWGSITVAFTGPGTEYLTHVPISQRYMDLTYMTDHWDEMTPNIRTAETGEVIMFPGGTDHQAPVFNGPTVVSRAVLIATLSDYIPRDAR